MSIWGKLFGSDKVIGGVVDGVYNGVDKLAFTTEEKAEYFHKMLKLYEPFKIAQRLLACIFGIPYAFAWTVTFLVSFFFPVETQLKLLSGDIATIVGVIVGFYFGGGAIEGIVRGAREK